MRAAIWDGPGEMHLGDVPDPVCPPDGALLRVTACGICGTDVRAFYNGDRRIEPQPNQFRHELHWLATGGQFVPGHALESALRVSTQN